MAATYFKKELRHLRNHPNNDAHTEADDLAQVNQLLSNSRNWSNTFKNDCDQKLPNLNFSFAKNASSMQNSSQQGDNMKPKTSYKEYCGTIEKNKVN